MKKVLTISVLCFALIIASLGVSVKAASILTLTTSTDSTSYNRYTTVTLSGSLIYNNLVNGPQPESDGIVGVQINDSTRPPRKTQT